MSSVVRWDSQEGWQDWVNESASGRLPRLIGSALKLPFARIPHLGTSELHDGEFVARWSWGQRQRTEFNQPYLLEADLLNDDDTLNPIVGGNLGHTTIIDGTVELSEYGFNTVNRNSHLNVSNASDFNYPDNANAVYMSCWFKSHLVNYSSGLAIIAAGHSGVVGDTLQFAIIIDTDNKVKGMTVNSDSYTIPPVGGDVVIDGNWHHALFVLNNRGATSSVAVFVVDNEWGDGPTPNSEYTFGYDAGNITRFDIGSSSISGESAYGFSGIIDELVISKWAEIASLKTTINNATSSLTQTEIFGAYLPSYRFESNVLVSPIVDTERDNSLFTGLYAEYENPNGSSVQFSFRASDALFDQDDTSVEWTGFTAPNKVLHATSIGHEDLGIWMSGRYQQVRIRVNPSTVNSPIADDLQLETPVVHIIELSTGVATKVLGATQPSFEPGLVLGQIFTFEGEKNIDKVSLNLTVNTQNRQSFVIGAAGHVAFQAANWQDSRDDWVFQPIPHWVAIDDAGYEDAYGLTWETSGVTIRNTRQLESWPVAEESIANAPYLKYQIFFPSGGTYQLWGYGYTSNGIFYTFDDDETDLRQLTLGEDLMPRWTRFGSFFLEEGGLHAFSVYLADINTTILDQWLFTQNPNMDAELANDEYASPQPNSMAPFNTAVRLRSLYNGELDDLVNPQSSPANNVTMWLPSRIISASGKFNYEVVDDNGNIGVVFIDGVSLEFWQVGGTSSHFASWDYSEAE